MKPKFTTVDEALAAAPDAALPLLRKIRTLARKSSPGAEERISYGMPAVFVDGRVLIYFGAFKEHVGLFPPPHGDATFMKSIAPYVGPKGNLSFPFGAKVSDTVLKAIIAARLATVLEARKTTGRTKAKAGPKTKPEKAAAPTSPKTGEGSFARRTRWPMPAFVKRALQETHLTDAYNERPPYQRNDYVGWIIHAKTPATKMKRLAQMLDELERGGVYMRMKHPGSARKT